MPAIQPNARSRPALGLLTLGLGLGWLFTLLGNWNEVTTLVTAGFPFATLSVLQHQVVVWTVVALVISGLWVVLSSTLSRAIPSPLISSALTTALAIAPIVLFRIYRSSLAEGIYFGNFMSPGFRQFAFESGIRAILLWLVAVVVFETWRRFSATAGLRVLAAPALALTGLWVLMGVVTRAAEPPASTDPPPNVILIVVDALRPDHLGAYGYARSTTPNIDELAAQGLRFETAISQSTLTKTSIASLFTGLNPYRHGVYSGHKLTDGRIYSDTLPESLQTLAGSLRAGGYITAAWLQQSQLKAASGYDRGFLFYNENGRDIEAINRRFRSWIQRIGRSAPIFAYLHYIDLHDPYRPEPPFDALYGETGGIGAKLDYTRWKQTLEEIQTGTLELSPQDVAQLINLYDGQLTFIDAQLGRLFESLRHQGLFDTSLIIVTADHGDGFMEHGFISHSVLPYDELIKVPLIVRLPAGASAGTQIDSQVRLIDVMPSILDFTGIPVPEDLDGQSVITSIDTGIPEQLAVSEVEMQVGDGYEYFASVRSREWKVIGNNQGPLEIYNLQLDPEEQENLVAAPISAIAPMVEVLRSISRARESLQVEQIPLDEQTQERLRALGYIE